MGLPDIFQTGNQSIKKYMTHIWRSLLFTKIVMLYQLYIHMNPHFVSLSTLLFIVAYLQNEFYSFAVSGVNIPTIKPNYSY